MKYTLLLIDDDPDIRNALKDFLCDESYKVFLASNLSEADQILSKEHIDLILLDQNLKNEYGDSTGLLLAKNKKYNRIPKIIITAYNIKPNELTRLLDMEVGEYPNIIQVINKEDDEFETVLLSMIKKTLQVWPEISKISKLSDRLSKQIDLDNLVSRKQAKFCFIISQVVSFLGLLLIVISIFFAWKGSLTIGIVSTTSGVILEAIGFLYFRQLRQANVRMDCYHKEQFQIYWFEILLAASEQLPGLEKSTTINNVILQASSSFFSGNNYKNEDQND